MTGMDGHDLPPPVASPIDEPAADFIARTAAATRGLHLVATGPLTNIARVLTAFPGTGAALAGISIMGGSTGQGNATPVAEYNIQADPEAADIVFGSGVPIRMVGLNVTRQVAATPERRRRLRIPRQPHGPRGGRSPRFLQRPARGTLRARWRVDA